MISASREIFSEGGGVGVGVGVSIGDVIGVGLGVGVVSDVAVAMVVDVAVGVAVGVSWWTGVVCGVGVEALPPTKMPEHPAEATKSATNTSVSGFFNFVFIVGTFILGSPSL